MIQFEDGTDGASGAQPGQQVLISAKILVPLDEDFPMLGGQILRVKTGVEFAYDSGKPIVRLRGVSVMGVPLPNAWLGGLKNIDLVQEFGNDQGFWKAFSDGVAAVTLSWEPPWAAARSAVSAASTAVASRAGWAGSLAVRINSGISRG